MTKGSDNRNSTLTHRVAAIVLKMLHLQFRMKKIFEDQERLRNRTYSSNREKIRAMGPAAYSFIDMLISFEHVESLMSDIFATKEIRTQLGKDEYTILNRTKALAKKWQFVRNKLGGHVDFECVQAVCETHNFIGVPLSEDLETDISVYNCLLIEGAVNITRNSSDIMGRDLDFNKNGLASELALVVERINVDWNEMYSYFTPMMTRLYEIGKDEKIAATLPNDRVGLVVGV